MFYETKAIVVHSFRTINGVTFEDIMTIDLDNKKIYSGDVVLPFESDDEQKPEIIVGDEIFYGLIYLLTSNGFEETKEN